MGIKKEHLFKKTFIFLLSFFLVFNLSFVLANEDHEHGGVDNFDEGFGVGGDTDPLANLPVYLKSQINDKAKELAEIQQRISETQDSLNQTQEEKNTLSGTIKNFDGTIKQLNLGIKSSETKIQKLQLELNGIEDNITTAESLVVSKTKAIGKSLRELALSDGIDPILIILKPEDLSDGLSDLNSLESLREALVADVNDLNSLRDQLSERKEEVKDTKINIESEYKNTKNKKAILDSERQEKAQLLKETKNKEKNYQALITDLAKKQEQIASEIEGLEAGLRGEIKTIDIPAYLKGLFSWPVPSNTRITQGYGATAFAKNGYKGKWHNGVDIAASTGTEVVAVLAGTVVAIGDQDLYCRKGAYGKFIVLKHSNNLVTLYGHFSKQILSLGDTVKKGEVIGYAGKTGYATGSHLHLTVYDGNTFSMRPSRSCGPMPSGGDLDPNKYL